jgi:hypothetical protein
MFGRKDRREQAIQRLRESVDEATAAVARGDGADLEMVFERLSDSLIDAPDNPIMIGRYDPELDNLKQRGWKLREQLSERLGATRDRDVARKLPPCVRCGGREILVSDPASIETLYIGNAGQQLPFTLAVCRACGDIRMTATDPAVLLLLINAAGARGFRLITVEDGGGKAGPYR